jgi:hypothetical protein
MLSGQDFPEEVELLDQLVRSRALGADRAEHQLPTVVPPTSRGTAICSLDASENVDDVVQDLVKLLEIQDIGGEQVLGPPGRCWGSRSAVDSARGPVTR